MFSSISTPCTRCLLASWLGLAVLSLTFDGLGAGGQCKFDLQEYQERRIAAIKGQILSKLGLTALPTDDGPEEVDKRTMDLYNLTVSLLEEKYQNERQQCQGLAGSSDDYFAQLPILYGIVETEIEKVSIDIGNYATVKKLSKFFRFDLTSFEDDSQGDEVSEAEFRLYQVPNEMKDTEQQIDLFQLIPSYNSTEEPTRRFLTSWTVSTTREGWLAHDVTDVVREWVADPESNLGFEVNLNCGDYLLGPVTTTPAAITKDQHKLHVLFADPRGTFPSMDNGRGDGNPRGEGFPSINHPRLVVMAPANHSKGGESNSVRRRRSASYSSSQCDQNSPNCCLRPLLINFRRDLKWNWIRQPRVYSPNFCAGSCPYILSADTSHASVLSLYKHLNPDASPSPCCSPHSFRPLTILFYNRGRPEIRQLNNMIIESCRCS
ncbi:transforming growth factor beta-2 proprotein-like [Lytechinus pictus]|uniref:transforming growth factor beta-2 proprotein-like n=1 Tax=Lytechinus pictus TaxID=7653 RepID=UPI0030B9F395